MQVRVLDIAEKSSNMTSFCDKLTMISQVMLLLKVSKRLSETKNNLPCWQTKYFIPEVNWTEKLVFESLEAVGLKPAYSSS